MLTNRHHYTRWSLEQNREVIVEGTPQTSHQKSRWIRRGIIFLLFMLVSIVITATIKYLEGRLFYHSEEFKSLLDATEAAIIVQDHRENDAHGVLLPVEAPKAPPKITNHNYAYVTLLCDNSGLANARVLAYALKRVKSAFQLVVMTSQFATEGLDDLITLGAAIEKISLLPAPFKRANGKRASFQKTCKYSKIHAWSLTKYSKLVYLDLSLLIVNVSIRWDLSLTLGRILMRYFSIPNFPQSRLSEMISIVDFLFLSPP